MKLLPYDNLTLYSPLSPAEVIARVKSVTTQTGSTFIYMGYSIPDGYVGTVDENSFSITMHKRFQKNSFKPVINGEVAPGVGGTIIKLKIRMHLSVVIFLIIWFTFGLAACVMLLSQFFTNPDPLTFDSLDLLIPVAMIVFFYAVILFSFHGGVKKARTTFETLLQAKEIENWS